MLQTDAAGTVAAAYIQKDVSAEDTVAKHIGNVLYFLVDRI